MTKLLPFDGWYSATSRNAAGAVVQLLTQSTSKCARRLDHRRSAGSESHRRAALELQDLAGLVRGGDDETHSLDDLPHGADLRGVRLRELAGSEPQAVLQADAYVAAHRRRHGRDRQLVPSRAQHAPPVLVAEQAIRRAFHVRDIVRVRTDAAQNPEYALDEKRRLDHAAVEEMSGG